MSKSKRILVSKHDVEAKKYPFGEAKTLHHSNNLSIFHINIETKTKEHKHEKIEEVYYVEKGIGEIVINGSPEVVEMGDIIVVPKGEWHYLKTHNEVEFEVLSITSPGYDPDDYITKEE